MHPKTLADMEVPDDLWNEMRDDVAWLMEQLFNFFSLLQQKHGDKPGAPEGRYAGKSTLLP